MIIISKIKEVKVKNTTSTDKKVKSKRQTTKNNKQETNKINNKKKSESSKKRIIRKKVFEAIPEEKFFIMVDGKRLKHYIELADELEHFSRETINHHITPFRHDFANWIRDVFEEHELADKILKTNNPHKIRTIIYQHIIRKYLR